MAFQLSDDSFGIRRLGFKCSWHPRQANDAVASEPSIFSENHNYRSIFRVAVNTYVTIYVSRVTTRPSGFLNYVAPSEAVSNYY